MLNQLQWQQFKNLEICYTEIILAVNEMERVLKNSFPEEYAEANKGWLSELRNLIKKEVPDSSHKTIKDTLDIIKKK
jgi:hypothetical protein